MSSFHFLWQNGGRPLVLSASAAVLGLAILGAVLLVANLWPQRQPFAPLGDYNIPQPLEAHDIPIGGSLHVTLVRKCNLSGDVVSVNGEMHWRRLDDGSEMVVSGVTGSKQFEPGCLVRSMENPLPVGVGPGVWILEGTDTAFRGDDRQQVTWRTEEFKVVP